MQTPGERPALIRALQGERVDPAPIWIMRQAGRYLPEYRALRARSGSFLDFCYAPALAAEAALQPLRRFPLDAAILFSDILVIPDALGRKVWFVEGEGPRLEPLIAEEQWRFAEPAAAIMRLGSVYEAVSRIRAALPASTPLIGFAGAPWTVATYMLQGEGGDKDRARRAAYQRPQAVDDLLAVLAEATALHLAEQVRAGADCLQLFESWAEGLSPSLFERLVITPNRAVIARLRALGVRAPVIAFPRGAGANLQRYAQAVPVQGLGLDTSVDAVWARAIAPAGVALQGNLDPELVVVGGAALSAGVETVLANFAGGPHIFNLGHGITPAADPAHVAALVAQVKRL